MKKPIDRLEEAIAVYLKETDDEEMLTGWIIVYETTEFVTEDGDEVIINGVETAGGSTVSTAHQVGLLRLGMMHIERNMYGEDD